MFEVKKGDWVLLRYGGISGFGIPWGHQVGYVDRVTRWGNYFCFTWSRHARRWRGPVRRYPTDVFAILTPRALDGWRRRGLQPPPTVQS